MIDLTAPARSLTTLNRPAPQSLSTQATAPAPAAPPARLPVPPQDLEAEQSVLGAMLLFKDAIADVVEILTGADFYKPAHTQVFETILDLYGRGEPADAILVAAELARLGDLRRIGGRDYLHTLVARVPTVANAGYYAEVVRDAAVLRRLAEAATRIAREATSGAGDADQVVDRAQADILAVPSRRAAQDYLPIAQLIQPTIEEIEASHSHDTTLVGVPTGFTELDALTNELHPGQLIVIGARPAVGKSCLAIDFAMSAAIHHDQATVIFSLEMSRTEIVTRVLAAEARVSMHSMRRGSMRQDDWNRVSSVIGQVSDAPLFIDDSPNMTLMEIRAKARRLKQRDDLRLVILDYLQLMTSGKRVESRQQEVSEFSRSLKLLAKELQVPVVALSQLNRGPEQRVDKRPMLADRAKAARSNRTATSSSCCTEKTPTTRNLPAPAKPT